MTKQSPSSSARTLRRTISEKDRKHRAIVKRCVDRLINFFWIVTAIELPKPSTEKAIHLIWNKIFEAGKLDKQVRVSIKLEEYVKSMWTVLGIAKSESSEFDVLMQPLQQQFLNQDYSQHGGSSVMKVRGLDEGKMGSSLPLLDDIAKCDHIAKNKGAAIVEAQLKLNNLVSLVEPLLQYLRNQDRPYCHQQHGISFDGLAHPDSNQDGIESNAEQLLGRPVFSVLEHVDSLSQCSVENQVSSSYPQRSDLNSNPKETKQRTHNKQHLMRKKQGHIALKVFFYMYTGIVLPRKWKDAEVLIERKINDAKEEGEKVIAMIERCATADGVDQIFKSALIVFEAAKETVSNWKYCLQLDECGQKIFQKQAYPNSHKQHGASSEDVILDLGGQGLGFNSPLLASSIQNGRSSVIYEQKWNGFVLEELQNSMREISRATGSSDGAIPLVEPEAAASLSPVCENLTTFAGCGEFGENELLLMQLIELFPAIEKDGFKEMLLSMANTHRPDVKFREDEVESVDMRISQLGLKMNKINQDLGTLRAKRKRKHSG